MDLNSAYGARRGWGMAIMRDGSSERTAGPYQGESRHVADIRTRGTGSTLPALRSRGDREWLCSLRLKPAGRIIKLWDESGGRRAISST
jgi:hypothetical protein